MLRRALRPPVRDAQFWAVQAAVVGLAALHFYLDASGRLESTAFPTGLPVTLLLVPVLYAALRYGVTGAVATAVLATLLWLPDLALPDAHGHPAADAGDLLIVDAVAVFVGIHIDRGRLQRRRADAAERQRREAERREHEAVRTYAALLLTAHEEERLRIARDIHDDPLQRLIALARRMDRPDAADAQAREQLLDVIGRLRDIARGLRPPGLDQLGLVAALRGLLADEGDAARIAADLDVAGNPVRLASAVELGAFRIVQEALYNVTRHASAHHVRVAVDYDGDALRISVADDGVGFDPEAFAGAGNGSGAPHLGLLGMRERATLLGGQLRLTSRAGRGTTVDVVLPAGAAP
ncbi:MAG TPA: sensor histidine kinase [Candidatus Dormibacteraeota bacterium]|nr:sensor histidine kinase [Candidatus Dormibacteraeota bacterium]